MASLPEANGAVKGLTKPQIVENLVAPQRSDDRVRRRLRASSGPNAGTCTSGRTTPGSSRATRTCGRRSRNTPTAPRNPRSTPKCSGGCWRPSSRGAGSPTRTSWRCRSSSDIKTSGGRVLLVLSPDKRIPPDEAKRLFDSVTEKNNFCVVTGDGTDLAKLEDKVRRIWAVAKVRDEDGGDKSPNVAELNEEAEQAEFEFNATLTEPVQPSLLPRAAPEGRRRPPLGRAQDDADQGEGRQVQPDRRRDRDRGRAWPPPAPRSSRRRSPTPTSTPCGRAPSNMLWIGGGDRRARWKDVEERAICNVRWPWLPPKGLDDLRKRAISIRRLARQRRRLHREGPVPAAPRRRSRP